MPKALENRTDRKLPKRDIEALAQFRYQLRLFLHFSETAAREHQVTPLQYQLMLQIGGFPDRDWACVSELAERLQSKHHGVVALISRCEALGLVWRRPSEADLRQVEVRLTALGKQRLDQLARLHRDELQTLRRILALLSTDAKPPRDHAAP